MKMNAVKTRVLQEIGDFSEAACVDEDYDYLLKNEDQGISFK